jgi:hypothetical protein
MAIITIKQTEWFEIDTDALPEELRSVPVDMLLDTYTEQGGVLRNILWDYAQPTGYLEIDFEGE